MQVYRGMNIGTAKPSDAEQARVRHFMIDVADPEETYTVATFQRVAREILDRHRGPVLVAGGSGLHMRAVFDPLDFPPHDPEVRASVTALSELERSAELLRADPDASTVIDMKNPRRVERALEVVRITGLTPTDRAGGANAESVRNYQPSTPFHAFGVDPGERLEERVRSRVGRMLDRGLLAEVAGLTLGETAGQAVGYKQLLPVVAGEKTLATAQEEIVRATLALAKRQRTYFRRDPRITWLPWTDSTDDRFASLEAEVDKVLA